MKDKPQNLCVFVPFRRKGDMLVQKSKKHFVNWEHFPMQKFFKDALKKIYLTLLNLKVIGNSDAVKQVFSSQSITWN